MKLGLKEEFPRRGGQVMLSFKVSFVPSYLTLIYPVFFPNNGFQMFSKTKMFSKCSPKEL